MQQTNVLRRQQSYSKTKDSLHLISLEAIIT